MNEKNWCSCVIVQHDWNNQYIPKNWIYNKKRQKNHVGVMNCSEWHDNIGRWIQ